MKNGRYREYRNIVVISNMIYEGITENIGKIYRKYGYCT